ncbi:hypothetical protein BDA99DRAFT_496446 [Phascolomyces articulosus]|uniref:Uncharacterized protein n=1 Tax=Phascolomyces articulosus TaxID=60185 RepID=A0AAD5K9V5_9FUNG|nr:hypothetical protein BDA99DRAFT_496446 [Phascolomyces articulosus]
MTQIFSFKVKTIFLFPLMVVIVFFEISMLTGANASPIAVANPSSENDVSSSSTDHIVARAIPNNVQGPVNICTKGTEGFQCFGSYKVPPNGKLVTVVGWCQNNRCNCPPTGYAVV